MKKFIFINSNSESVEFYLSPFFIDALTGIDGVDADLQSQSSPYQDGEIHLDVILQSRFITLQGTIINTSDIEILEKRRQLSKICNPKLGVGLVKYINSLGEYEIDAVPDGGVSFPEKSEEILPQFEITFKCPNPYWRSPVITEEPMAAFVPLFEFPFEDEFEIGMEGHETVINNNSDVEVPIQIEIKGPTVNPCLTNTTTGEMIRIKRELFTDDLLVIDTTNGNKKVLLNGENVFHWLDLRSTFFKLKTGENILKFTADSGTETATLNIKLQELYNAV